MAPEIINGKGYNQSVDLWLIGIVLFEFMCGGVPFAEVIFSLLPQDDDDPF
jgi:cGMP-dependent protein kinase